eukprot:SAG25_NODE_2803_length_1377_cov_1.924883_1_plen_173_part_00
MVAAGGAGVGGDGGVGVGGRAGGRSSCRVQLRAPTPTHGPAISAHVRGSAGASTRPAARRLVVGGGGGTTSTQVEQRVSLRHAAQHTLLALHAKERNGGAPPPSQHTPAVTLTTPPALQLRGGGARVWLGPRVGDARLHTNNGKYSGPIAAAAAIHSQVRQPKCKKNVRPPS